MNLNWLPNTISASRIVLTLSLFVLAYYNLEALLAIVLIIAFLTDLADGMAARILKQTTKKGVKLDSIADYILFLSLPAIVYLARPEAIAKNMLAIGMLIGLFLLELAVGYTIQKQFVPFHHYLSKAANIITSIFVVYAIAYGFNNQFFIVVYIIMALSILEDIAAYLAYKKPKFNKITIFYGLKKPAMRAAAIRMLTITGSLAGFSAYVLKLQVLKSPFIVLSAVQWGAGGLAIGLILGLAIKVRLRKASD